MSDEYYKGLSSPHDVNTVYLAHDNVSPFVCTPACHVALSAGAPGTLVS